MRAPSDSQTVIVGGSAAGLACAMCLQKKGLEATVLEQHPHVAHAWRHHYDRLHLHTHKGGSGLPYLKMPRSYPTYPGREQVVEYLERYAEELDHPPLLNQEVTSVERNGTMWVTATHGKTYTSRHVIIATGNSREPILPTWEAMDDFGGSIVHSSQYRNGTPYRGKRVLVVGFGNSACEIAICLHEHGAQPAMSVRNPVNVIPRDILGVPASIFSIVQSKLPARLVDGMNWPLVRLSVGDITKYGLKKLPYGPLTQIKKHQRIPLLDIGTMKLIKEGRITVYPGIEKFTTTGVVFSDGRLEDFDAVILGTGYRSSVKILRNVPGALDDQGTPFLSGQATDVPGLYFCGFRVVSSGGLREFGIEAKRIASMILKTERLSPARRAATTHVHRE